jgi:hypothetical protein
MTEKEKQLYNTQHIRKLLEVVSRPNELYIPVCDLLDALEQSVEENRRLRKALEDLNQFSRSIMEQDIIDKALGEENEPNLP